MGNFDFQAAMPHLRILEYFLVVVDRSAGHVTGFELGKPPRARPLAEYLPQQRNERGAIRDAPRHGGVARIGGELRPASDLAKARELAVVADREDDMAVGGGEPFVGDDVRVRIAVASRDFPCGESVWDLCRAEGDDGIE